MNKLCLLGAAALIATALLPDAASAQRGGGMRTFVAAALKRHEARRTRWSPILPPPTKS